MKEDFLGAVTFKMRPNTYPGKLEWRKGEHEKLRVPGRRNVLCDYLEISSNGLFGASQVLCYIWGEEYTNC